MLGQVGGAYRGEVVDAGRGESLGVPLEIPAVRREGVAGQATLDRQVVEVAPDGKLQGQLSTSASGSTCMPCASATGP